MIGKLNMTNIQSGDEPAVRRVQVIALGRQSVCGLRGERVKGHAWIS
jgi:hypothetical protein